MDEYDKSFNRLLLDASKEFDEVEIWQLYYTNVATSQIQVCSLFW